MSISLLALRLGGRPLLYVLNHAQNLPSIRAVYNRLNMTRITPTIGPITKEHVISNINEVIINPIAKLNSPPPPRGVSIMMDETKIERKPSWFKYCDSVGGFCHMHTSASQVLLSSYDAGIGILAALKSGSIHWGKEISVVRARK